MRDTVPEILEVGRVTDGPFASTFTQGFNGVFHVRGSGGGKLRIVANTAALGWEHVSVSLEDRCPTWEEMCWVKGLFWEDEETVLQFHPAKSVYVNQNCFCLHMWRPVGFTIPSPPTGLMEWTLWRLVRNAVGNRLVGMACWVRGTL